MSKKFTHSPYKWKVSDNRYISMWDMAPDHIQSALFYSENRIVHWNEQKEIAEHNTRIFRQKREQLMEVAAKQGYPCTSLKDSDSPKYAVLEEAL